MKIIPLPYGLVLNPLVAALAPPPPTLGVVGLTGPRLAGRLAGAGLYLSPADITDVELPSFNLLK